MGLRVGGGARALSAGGLGAAVLAAALSVGPWGVGQAVAEPSISLMEKLADERAEAFLSEQGLGAQNSALPPRAQALTQSGQATPDGPGLAQGGRLEQDDLVREVQYRREGRRARGERRAERRIDRRRLERRGERRVERRIDRRVDRRLERRAADRRIDRRVDRRLDRRAERRRLDRRLDRRAARRAWRREGAIRRNGRLYAPPRAYRRGRVLPPRYYREARHGPRYRYRHGRYTYFYDGWWYVSPWWLLAYPTATTVVYEYPVEADVYGYAQGGAYSSNEFDDAYREDQARCAYWSDRCIENWGFQNPNYRGCLRYHGCD